MSNEMVEIKGMDKLMKKLDESLWRDPAIKFLNRAGITVQNETRKLAPVDTGLLRSSIGVEVDTSKLEVKIGTSIFYAPYQEYGTGVIVGKARHFPPGEALGLWAARHGYESGGQVARIIGTRGGLRARRYLRGGLEAAVEKIDGYLRLMMEEIRRKWLG